LAVGYVDDAYQGGMDTGETWLARKILQSISEIGSQECPCKIADTPCQSNCTCVQGCSSAGCMCCATYGSEEQRKHAANRLVKQSEVIDGLLNLHLAPTIKIEHSLLNEFERPMTQSERIEWVFKNRKFYYGKEKDTTVGETNPNDENGKD